MTVLLILPTESEALNGTSLDPWYGPVFLENVMCNGTETFGYQCATPGAGVITNPECYYPNRTAGVRCTMSEWSKVTCFSSTSEMEKYAPLNPKNVSISCICTSND